MHTVYVVGAAGQLGRALAATRPGSATMVGLTSADIDITDADSVRRALADLRRGDVVINAAAYTNVDGAESDADRAFAVNATGAANLAALTAAADARLIQVSTDYVYGAVEDAEPLEPEDLDDSTPPATVYGVGKLAGERAVLDADPDSVVVRTAWVYTGAEGARDFVGTMRRLAGGDDPVSVVDDQRGSPTYALDLAAGLWQLSEQGSGGLRVLHATNAGEATWYDLARAAFAGVGADPDRVTPCTTEEFPRPAPRPPYSVLSGRSWAEAGLTPLRDWRDGLAAALG